MSLLYTGHIVLSKVWPSGKTCKKDIRTFCLFFNPGSRCAVKQAPLGAFAKIIMLQKMMPLWLFTFCSDSICHILGWRLLRGSTATAAPLFVCYFCEVFLSFCCLLSTHTVFLMTPFAAVSLHLEAQVIIETTLFIHSLLLVSVPWKTQACFQVQSWREPMRKMDQSLPSETNNTPAPWTSSRMGNGWMSPGSPGWVKAGDGK